MPRIGIIDDREEPRETVKRSLEAELIEGWESIDISPFPQLVDYPGWIAENEIIVILLDERLDEQVASRDENVSYRGHNLVDFLRERFPTLPVYVITAWPDDEELKERFKDVEEIIRRADFSINAAGYVPRIMRAGQKFLETFQSELAELSDKAEKIAKGEALNSDVERVKAIRSKIGYAYPSETFSKQSDLLEILETNLKEIEKLKKEIEKYLARNK